MKLVRRDALKPAVLVAVCTLLSAALLSGCATSAGVQSADSGGPLTNRERYILAVENSAVRNNAEVHWVNPPDDEDLDEYVQENGSER